MSMSAYNCRYAVAKTAAVFVAILSTVSLTGCVTRQPTVPAPGQTPVARLVPSPLVGQPFDVVPAQSLLIVLVYRAGPLAGLGHNHVIACHCLTGTIYLPDDPLRASFDVRMDVSQFVVDDPALRASEHSADFPPDVPDSARQGTRHNMLGSAMLQAEKYPYVELRSSGLRRSPDGLSNDILVAALVKICGSTHSIVVPMHYENHAGEIIANGEFPLKQTDLGVTPFSTLGGALRVRNSITVRLRLTARRRAS